MKQNINLNKTEMFTNTSSEARFQVCTDYTFAVILNLNLNKKIRNLNRCFSFSI